jgi:hypothetical protein
MQNLAINQITNARMPAMQAQAAMAMYHILSTKYIYVNLLNSSSNPPPNHTKQNNEVFLTNK